MGHVLIPPDCMSQVAAGDKKAFETLYDLTYRQVYSLLLSLTMNENDAKDLLQETYLRVLGSADLYHEGNPMAWIMKIGKNLFLMEKRKKRPEPVGGEEDLENISIDWNSIEDVENRVYLEQLFLQLTQEEREIVVMHVVGGFHHREIAEFLNEPQGTVLSKYSRAIQKLKRSAESAAEGAKNV